MTGVTYYLQSWVIEKRDPVFLAMSTPLSLVITIFFSAVVLNEVITLSRYTERFPVYIFVFIRRQALTISTRLVVKLIFFPFYNSILGGIFLVGGLYSVLWGKSKEQRLSHNCSNSTPDEINLQGTGNIN